MLTRWIESCKSTGQSTLALIILCGLSLSPLDASQPQSLHARIDQLISTSHVGPTSTMASDAEFMRRVYLDLIGRVPSMVETRAFLADAAGDKRAKLVDDLLGRDEANRHLAVVFDVWMMERRADQHVTTDQWRQYLYRSFADGKSYGQLSREILTGQGDDEQLKPAAKFYLDRNAETHSMTRDVSRVFFGRDIQCAQCHDHPLIADYSQMEYYGLFAFLNRSFLFQDEKDKKKVALAERAEGDATYSSVFEPDSEKTTAIPALSDGIVLDDEPQFASGEGYRVKPAKNVRPIPEFSRRQHLADLATGQSEAFKRNIANRLWRHMLGRGLVEPPDLHHPDNPATYPELLQLLSDEFAKLDFDVKAFLRELALTEVYQRAIDLPTDVDAEASSMVAELDELKAQIGFQDSVVQRIREQLRESSIQVSSTRRELSATKTELATLLDSIGQAEKTRAESAAELAKAEKDCSSKQELTGTIKAASEAAAKAAEQLKDDAELASAAKTFGDRTKKLAAELAELEKKATQLKAAHENNLSNCETLRQHVAPLETKRAEILQQIGRRSGAQQALRRQLKAEQDRHLDLSQRIEAIEQLIQYDARQKARLAITARSDELKMQQGQRRKQKQNLVSRKRALESQITQLQDSIGSESQLLHEAEQGVASYRSLVDSVQLAAEQTEMALRTLTNDSDLAQAHQTLLARVQQLTSQCSQLQTNARGQETKLANLKQQVSELEARLGDERSQISRVEQQLSDLEAAVGEGQQQQDQADSLVKESRDRLNRLWKERFVVTSLKPLTPEQMADSLIRTLGLDQRFRAEAEAAWTKDNKDKKDAEPSAEKREQQIDELYAKREKQVMAACVSLFASSPGSPQDVFHATIDQALFFANDGRIRDWLRPTPGTLSKRLAEMTDDRSLAEELYLSVLSRKPSDDEVQLVVGYLGKREVDRAAAQQELIWSMLTSLEFRFNH